MRIAVIGGGISGLTAARLLHPEHEIAVFEAADRPGGHSHTVEIEEGDRTLAIDTGFIVYNERNYPGFCRLLERIGVEGRDSEMSFSVRDEASGLEYRGSSFNTLFAQRRNLFRPRFHRMLRDIVRFYREAPALLDVPDPGPDLGPWLDERGYSGMFVEQHILPMGAALWSAGPESIRAFPAKTFVKFLHNHAMLRFRGRPRWKTIRGGSREYVRALVAPFEDRLHLATPVAAVRRDAGGVRVRTRAGVEERFDHVILACHSDQALAMLADPTPAEREILGAMPYQENEVILHTDASVLPRTRRAWSSWNVHLLPGEEHHLVMTYYMNRLQGLEAERHYCVTLNRGEHLDPARVLRRFTYHHPLYTAAGMAARARRGEIDGVDRTHFCGAYWGYGFHEDGVQSALRVVERFGAGL